MTSKRPLASKDHVVKNIETILAYHQQGKESIQLPPAVSIAQQAATLRWNETKLRKARQFAYKTGYSETRLESLFRLLRKHRPIFGIAHVMELVTVAWPDREQIQKECIRQNWSVKDLKTTIKQKYGKRKHGGRRRKVTSEDVLVRLLDTSYSLLHLGKLLSKRLNGEEPIEGELPDKVRALHKATTNAASKLHKRVKIELDALRTKDV